MTKVLHEIFDKMKSIQEDEAKEKMMAASERVSELSSEAERNSSRTEEIRKDCQRILKWSELFDDSGIATGKMVTGYLIKRIDVYTDHRLHIEFNIHFAQFELGLDIPDEYKGQKPA